MSNTFKDESNKVQDKIDSNSGILQTLQPIFSNTYHTFIVRKSERLASALYVITGYMPQEEPIRGRLRVCALELITRAASPTEWAEGGKERFESRCAEIGAILQTAKYAGLVSPMNAQLISEEYAALASFVRLHAQKILEKGQELQKSALSEPKSLAGSIRQSNRSLLSMSNRSKRTDLGNTKEEDRKSIILSIFDKKGEISIKDASSLIPGLSEKTVQRELLALVASGVLIKSGSRRWTTYSKAS